MFFVRSSWFFQKKIRAPGLPRRIKLAFSYTGIKSLCWHVRVLALIWKIWKIILQFVFIPLPKVDFISCFAPLAYLLHLALNFWASKKLMRIKFSNREWPFFRLFRPPRLVMNTVIAPYLIFEMLDAWCIDLVIIVIIDNNSSSMHRELDEFYGVHVYLRSICISLVNSL